VLYEYMEILKDLPAKTQESTGLSCAHCSGQIGGYKFRDIFCSVNETGSTDLPGTVIITIQHIFTSRLNITLR
jgi:hypothetical protein